MIRPTPQAKFYVVLQRPIPSPISERYIDPLMPKGSPEFSRQLVQHRLDCLVGQMTQIRVDSFSSDSATGSQSEPTVPSGRRHA
jgi:hypothetical protein